MKRSNQGIFWAIFLLVAGAFLLLKNLGIFGIWGQVAWGGAFAVVGLIFLFSFIIDVQQWWRAIPAFVLISIGAAVLLEWRQIRLGDWSNSLVLFGMALAFWSVLVVRRENWWAELPAGVLTVLGVLLGLQSSLPPASPQWLVALLLGLGLVFALLYVLRLGERETWWPAVPATALILFAVVMMIGPMEPGPGLVPVLRQWWPLALALAGLVVLVLSAQRLPMRPPRGAAAGGQPAAGSDFEALPAAQGASVTHQVPDVAPPPAAAQPAPATANGQAQPISSDELYDMLKNQSGDAPAPEEGKTS